MSCIKSFLFVYRRILVPFCVKYQAMKPSKVDQNQFTFQDVTGIKILPIQIKLIKALSIFPDDSIGVYTKRFFDFLGYLVIFLATCQLYFCILGLKDAFINMDSLKIANGANFFGIFATMFHKFILCKRNMDEMLKLGVWAKNANSRRKNYVETLPLRLTKTVNLGHFIATHFVAISWSFYPLITHKTILPVKYPFFPEFITRINFPPETFMYFSVANIVSYVAGFFLYMVATVCTEAQILSDEWSKIKYDPNIPQQFMDQLKMCTNRHIELLGIIKLLKKFHEGLFGYQVFTSVSIMFGAIFEYSKLGSHNTGPVLLVGSLLGITTISEFFIMCWLGEKMTEAFQNFHRNVYKSNWYEAPVKERRCVEIIQEFTKKPVVLTGAKVIPASLATFIIVLRETFSLYTVCKTVLADK